jgi:hypothetical protein
VARQPSWETVARALGERMSYRDFCEAHPASDPDVDGCPFCKDRAAYQMFADKAGIQPPSPYTGPTLDVLTGRTSPGFTSSRGDA